MSEMKFYDLKETAGLAPSLSSQVAREIGKRIVSSIYRPEELIADEGALADRFQVSRSVIRDAIKILVGKGLLEVRRGIGTRVRPRQSWGILDDDVIAWQQSAPLNTDTIRQLMEVRLIVEPEAARLSAEKGSAELHEEIRQAVEQMEATGGFTENFINADAAFHRSVLRATENEFLAALEGVIFSALLNSFELTNSKLNNYPKATALHRAVYDEIAARNGEGAKQAMVNLLDDTRSVLGQQVPGV